LIFRLYDTEIINVQRNLMGASLFYCAELLQEINKKN